jgi:hypothetical protein
MNGSTERLHERVRALRARVAIQRWEIRQRGHAAGSWFALERLFALSRRAWILSAQDAETLVAAGYEPDPAGLAFEQPRRIFIVRPDEIRSLAGAREISIRSSAELLLAPAIALVPFAQRSASSPRAR